MAHRIQPGWRYTLAQLCLRLLFGRRWHFISPWYKAGIATIMLPFHGNKVLLGQRRGNIEYPGCWSGLGGFLEVPHEQFPEAIARELREETGLSFNPAQFASPDTVWISHGQRKLAEAESSVIVGYYYREVPAAFTNHLSTQEETGAFQWFTLAECRRMIKNRQIPADFTDLHHALEHAFAARKQGRKFAGLKMPA